MNNVFFINFPESDNSDIRPVDFKIISNLEELSDEIRCLYWISDQPLPTNLSCEIVDLSFLLLALTPTEKSYGHIPKFTIKNIRKRYKIFKRKFRSIIDNSTEYLEQSFSEFMGVVLTMLSSKCHIVTETQLKGYVFLQKYNLKIREKDENSQVVSDFMKILINNLTLENFYCTFHLEYEDFDGKESRTLLTISELLEALSLLIDPSKIEVIPSIESTPIWEVNNSITLFSKLYDLGPTTKYNIVKVITKYLALIKDFISKEILIKISMAYDIPLDPISLVHSYEKSVVDDVTLYELALEWGRSYIILLRNLYIRRGSFLLNNAINEMSQEIPLRLSTPSLENHLPRSLVEITDSFNEDVIDIVAVLKTVNSMDDFIRKLVKDYCFSTLSFIFIHQVTFLFGVGSFESIPNYIARLMIKNNIKVYKDLLNWDVQNLQTFLGIINNEIRENSFNLNYNIIL